MPDPVRLQVKRQNGPNHQTYWEEFEVPYSSGMNVITALQEIQKNPKRKDGKETSPVVWEASCLEEVCGACTMVINGEVRQACSTLVSQVSQPIRLEPMSKYPLIRDLHVNRKRIFDAFKKVKGWVTIDGTYDLGPAPRYSEDEQQLAYKLSTCMACGCCMEVCPQYTIGNDFLGAAPISQTRRFNAHPLGNMHKGERIQSLMEPGGLHDCGNAQNCVRACPKEIPLTESIADMGRQTTIYALKKLFWR